MDNETLMLTATIVGAIAGAVAGVAAILALIFAALGWRQGRQSLIPRPRCDFTMGVRVSNHGGVALSCCIVVIAPGGVHMWRGDLPQQMAPVGYAFLRLIPVPARAVARSFPSAVLITATDAEGRHWDCLAAKQIKGPWTKWANGELVRLGLDRELEFLAAPSDQIELWIRAWPL